MWRITLANSYRCSIWNILQRKLRRRRFRFFVALLSSLPRPLCILDVGGTPAFWQQMAFCEPDISIVILNRTQLEVSHSGMSCLVGDARNLIEFTDQQFDLVFSNSVIEHVGTYEQQRLMAREVQRVGKRYYVQTPDRYFPIEPHVLLPFFQFLPFWLQILVLCRCGSPWGWKLPDTEAAKQYLQQIRLLNERELRSLFPRAMIYRERFLCLTKSITAYTGWT